MAQRVHGAVGSNVNILIAQRDAHNSLHAVNTGSQVHNDGPEYDADPTGSPSRCPAFLPGTSSPVSAQQAADFLIAFKEWYQSYHKGMADEAVGEAWYAHKVPDVTNVITLGMSPWTVTESDLSEMARVLVNDLSTRYEGHRTNNGGVWHTAVDGSNILGTPLTFTGGISGTWTLQAGAERATLLKALMNDHFVLTTGSVHASADSGNVITSPNVSYGMSGIDWPAFITLLTEMRTKMISHVGNGTVHAIADTTNVVSAPVPAPGAGTFDMANQIITVWGAHIASTTHHNSNDTAAALVTTSVTTIAHMIALAQELYTKSRLHANNAPASRAIRLVV